MPNAGLETDKKNLILGLIYKYELNRVEPFLLSLKKTGYSGDVCFIVHDVAKATIDALRSSGVLQYQVGSSFIRMPHVTRSGMSALRIPYYKYVNAYSLNKLIGPILKSLRFLPAEDLYKAKCVLFRRFLHPQSARFLSYYLYLAKYGYGYSHIMLTDVRDVLFQRDPFDFDMSNKLCCFLEDWLIERCWWNSKWLSEMYGDDVKKKLEKNKIICSGVTIGNSAHIMRYLEVMIEHLVERRSHLTTGSDQGIHNYIIYSGLVDGVKLYENGRGPVLTMGYLEDRKIRFDDHGRLKNEDHTIINTLHQYDRRKDDIKTRIAVYSESVKAPAETPDDRYRSQ